MKKKKIETRVDVRERILREATKLFGERGFGGVALRDIAHACDIPLSTLSSHFARKKTLQDSVFRRAVETVIRRDVVAKLASGTPKQRFRQYLINVIELFLSDLPEVKVMDREFQELDKPSTFNRFALTSRGQAVIDSTVFISALAKDTESDILKVISPVQLTQMIFAAIYGMVKLRSMNRRVIGGRPIKKAELSRDIVLMFERMLGI